MLAVCVCFRVVLVIVRNVIFSLALLFAEKKHKRSKDLIMERKEIQSHVTGASFVLLPLHGSGVIAESITEIRINYIMS